MAAHARQEQIEWVVPLPVARDKVHDAVEFRSTWLTSSQATIREHGYGARYEANLDPRHKATLLSMVPGVWIPMDIARSHYLACDALGLGVEELFEIGKAATKRANATSLQLMVRFTKGVGVTPWTILAQAPRIVGQAMNGGGVICVARLGPKEARYECLGYPLASIPYNRVTMRGIVAAVIELFCQKAYVKEIPSLCDARSIGLRLSWA